MTNTALDRAADLRLLAGLNGLDGAAWQRLQASTGPFVHWDFLQALADSRCTGQGSGWQPAFMAVSRDGAVRSAAPAWIKEHSHGEFVFDWAWARAAMQAGLAWYPKLLVAAPFTPVTGPRLLGAEQSRVDAERLVEQLEQLVEQQGLSSAGVNFCTPCEAEILASADWLARFDWQFHWHNEAYRDFDDFLERFRRKARKNLRAERRKVRDSGWQFVWKTGPELTPQDIALVDQCYLSTFLLYGNRPSLNRDFFTAAARLSDPQLLVCLAYRDQQALAAAVFWRDAQRLYGRYWGSLVDARDLHFEACYYQGIEYCIEHGIEWFEPGAQGEHKVRRGFLPQRTRSYHYIRHPGMRGAIRRYLQAEAAALKAYRLELERLNPFT